MRTIDAIAEILKKEGIHILPSFPTTPVIEAAAAAGIKPVICRQERVGVGIADGWTRVKNGSSGRRVRDAVRPGRGERLRRRLDRLLRRRPHAPAAAGPPARARSRLSQLFVHPDLRVRHQVRGADQPAQAGRRHAAPRLHPDALGQAGTRARRGARRRRQRGGRSVGGGELPSGEDREGAGQSGGRHDRGQGAPCREVPRHPGRAGRALRRAPRRSWWSWPSWSRSPSTPRSRARARSPSATRWRWAAPRRR